MSTPLQFLETFRAALETEGIRYTITSGMACMHYRVQQMTKDSDWIVPPEDIFKLREWLSSMERQMPPWRVSYRSIFGAPLEESYHRHGWTSHLAIWETGNSPEQHLDFFGQPPRVKDQPATGWASRDLVARMKKTDRAKDWPILDALAAQSAAEKDWSAALHLISPKPLRELWAATPAEERPRLQEARPLLKWLSSLPNDLQLERLIAVETAIWQSVNRERYGHFQRLWKEFYRRWNAGPRWAWPTNEPFSVQHRKLLEAAEKHGLVQNPWTITGKDEIIRKGVARASALLKISDDELQAVLPPSAELIP